MRSLPLYLVMGGIAMICRMVAGSTGDTLLLDSDGIPVLQRTEVVVVGGSTAGVAAAVAAAQNGAGVVLVAARPYLGEDMTASYRLWLHPGEESRHPLAKAIYAPALAPEPELLRFTYTVSPGCSEPHPDTDPPSMLADGVAHDAVNCSIQVNGDATIDVDLGTAKPVADVVLEVFQRPKVSVQSVTVSASPDGQRWDRAPVVRNERLGEGNVLAAAFPIRVPVNRTARYLRVGVQKTEESERILLAELRIESGRTAAAAGGANRLVRPLHVKCVLEDALVASGVTFFYSCPLADVLVDPDGAFAGVVVGTRQGRMAIVAKVGIDATRRALLSRRLGASFRPFPAGTHAFRRVVMGGTPKAGPGIVSSKRLDVRVPPLEEDSLRKVRYSRVVTYAADRHLVETVLELPMPDGSVDSFQAVEQAARDLTWDPRQLDESERLWHVPPDRMHGRARADGERFDAARFPIGACMPAGIERVYVVGPCSDVSDSCIDAFLRPVNIIEIGDRAGRAAAADAGNGSGALEPALRRPRNDGKAVGRFLEFGDDPRLASGQNVPAAAGAEAEVLGRYDVVVVGGGTAGAPAAIAAAREGARVLLLEYLTDLGGVGTVGGIGNYWYGYHRGFTKEIDRGVAELGGLDGNVPTWGESEAKFRPDIDDPADRDLPWGWPAETKSEWFRRQVIDAGGDVWYNALVFGVCGAPGKADGVVVSTPYGAGVVLADVIVDATGNGDTAIAAGAGFRYVDAFHAGVQGAGLPPRVPGAVYFNTDYTHTDDTDLADIRRNFMLAKRLFSGAFDIGQLIATRERRRVVGEYTLDPLDVFTGRVFDDTIALGRSNFDKHGVTEHALFLFKPEFGDYEGAISTAHIPYRCLLPRGVDNVIVSGIGISAHTDCMPIIRMQADVHNQGFAAGTAAAMASRAGASLREVDVSELQRKLTAVGNIPEDVLAGAGRQAGATVCLEAAVAGLTDEFAGIAEVLREGENALAPLRHAYRDADSASERLVYAQVLGVLGDGTGGSDLIVALEDADWGVVATRRMVLALGLPAHPGAVPTLAALTGKLGPDSRLEDVRAAADAARGYRSARLAEAFYRVLRKPGMSGHAVDSMERLTAFVEGLDVETWEDFGALRRRRQDAWRELILARALFLCGDVDDLGRSILEQYVDDLSGVRARFALDALASHP